MHEGPILLLLAFICAVALDFLLVWMVRKRYAARYQAARGHYLARHPRLARLVRALSAASRAVRATIQRLATRQWVSVPPTLLLIVGSGMVLLCAGQVLREDWANRGPASLVVLGVGLLLLVYGIKLLKLEPAGIPLSESQHLSEPAQPRAWVPTGPALLGAGVLLAIIGGPSIQPRVLSVGWLALGVTSIGAGAWSLRNGLPGWLARLFAVLQRTFDVTPDRAIFLLAGMSLAVFASRLAGPLERMPYPALTIAAWLGGILLGVLGAWRPAHLPRPDLRAIAIGLGLALLALPLRTIGAATLPLGLTGDEGSAGLQSLQFLNGSANNIFTTGWFSFPTLYFWIQSNFLALFGRTAEALRYSSAFAGALEVAVTYWAARALFGRRAALLAGLYMVVFHFHIHFSRIGLNNVWDALFFTWALGAFWVGWERRSRGALVLAGLGLGLGAYFYVTTRLLFALLPLLALIFAWVQRRRLKDELPNLILMAWVALAIVLPLAWHFSQFPREFTAPMQRVQLTGDWLTQIQNTTGKSQPRILLDLFVKSFQAYTDTPTDVLYAPGSPLLQTIPAVLAWLSLAVFLTRWRDTRFWLLAGWLASLSAVGALSVYTPGGHRYIAAAPALAMIVGLGLSALIGLVNRLFNTPRWAAYVLAAGLLVAAGAQDLRLMYRYDSSIGFGGYNNMIAQALVEILRQEPPGSLVFFMGGKEMGYQSIPSLPYLVPHVTGLTIPMRFDPVMVGQPGTWNGLLVYLPRREDELPAVQAIFPEGRLSEVDAPDGTIIFYLFDPCPPYPYPAQMTLPATSLGLPYSFLRR